MTTILSKPLLPIAFLALAFVAGCTDAQLGSFSAKAQQVGTDTAAGRPVAVNVGSATQPAEILVPTGAIPYHEIIGGIIVLAGIAAGAFAHSKGVTSGQDTQTIDQTKMFASSAPILPAIWTTGTTTATTDNGGTTTVSVTK